MSPERRIAASEDRSATNGHAIRKVYLVPGRNYASITEREPGINRIDDVWFRNRVYFVHTDDFGITSQMNFISPSYDIQVPDSYMVTHLELLHPDDQIKVSNPHIIVDAAFLRVDDAQADAHLLADLVTKKQAIAGTF